MNFRRKFYRWYIRPILWRLVNPRRHAEDYYADMIASRLERGHRHPAIGPKARPLREPTELLAVLRQRGLTRDSVVVDYGCGSFRLGKALIHHLNPGKYWGLDVTDQFFPAGYDFLGVDLTAEKQPNARVIDAAGLADARRQRPDYIVSWHVCSKVPSARLEDYFGKMIGLMQPHSRVLVHFPETLRRRRMSRFSWAIPRLKVEQVLRSIDPNLDIRFSLLTEKVSKGVSQTVVEFAYPAAATPAAPTPAGAVPAGTDAAAGRVSAAR